MTNREKLINTIENCGYNVDIIKNYIIISKCSKYGENFNFSFCMSTPKKDALEIINYCKNFDEFLHAKMWNDIKKKDNINLSEKALIENAKEIKNDLKMLSDSINFAFK